MGEPIADRFADAFGPIPDGGSGTDRLAALAARAVNAGFAVVLVESAGKSPICTLTSKEVNEADRAAREKAFESGVVKWEKAQHACGWKHAFTDPVKAAAAIKRMSSTRLNVGVELTKSRMIVVDPDTADQVAAFEADLRAHGIEPPECPTVRTPGFQNAKGEWMHKDGGHYWFTVPDGEELPSNPAVLKLGPEGAEYSVYWADHQVLVPPSIRKEGPYRLTGRSQVAPTWLLDAIHEAGARHSENVEAAKERARARAAAGETDSGIDVWSTDVSWDDLLIPDGWTKPGKQDNCGCPIWTRPGDWSNWKSATAHEIGCSVFPCERGHGPLKIWTDSPPEFLMGQPSTLTKIQYEGAKHGGIAGACSDWGILRDGEAGIWDPLDVPSEPRDPFTNPGPAEDFDGDVDAEQARQEAEDEEPRDGPEQIDEERRSKINDMFPDVNWSEVWDGAKGEVWIVYPLLSEGRLITIYSEPKMGKSLLMLELAAGIAAGVEVLGYTPDRARKVLYVDFENTIDGDVVPRLKDMGWTPDTLGNLHYQSFPSLAALDSDKGGVQLLGVATAKGCEVVIIDTVSRAVDGGENDNDTWLNFYRKTGLKLKAAGLTTARLDHTGKVTTAGPRGGSAKLGDVDATWQLLEVERDVRYRLVCDDNRMVIPDKEVVVRRQTSPLRHVVESGGIDAFDEPVKPSRGGRPAAAQIAFMAVIRQCGADGCTKDQAIESAIDAGITADRAPRLWRIMIEDGRLSKVPPRVDETGMVVSTERWRLVEFDDTRTI